MSEQRYFLTVDWCNKGRRGIFCSLDGRPFSKETKHTDDEMGEILGLFDMVLAPKSILMTEEEVAKHREFYPLGEYSNQYGYAVIPEVTSE